MKEWPFYLNNFTIIKKTSWSFSGGVVVAVVAVPTDIGVDCWQSSITKVTNNLKTVKAFPAFRFWKIKFFCLKLVSPIFIKFLFFQMIALQKLWKMFFIPSKKLFSFWRYSNFCISVLPLFSRWRSLLWRMIEDKS